MARDEASAPPSLMMRRPIALRGFEERRIVERRSAPATACSIEAAVSCVISCDGASNTVRLG